MISVLNVHKTIQKKEHMAKRAHTERSKPRPASVVGNGHGKNFCVCVYVRAPPANITALLKLQMERRRCESTKTKKV